MLEEAKSFIEKYFINEQTGKSLREDDKYMRPNVLPYMSQGPQLCDLRQLATPMGPCHVFKLTPNTKTRLTIVCDGTDKETGKDNVSVVPAAITALLINKILQPDMVINAGVCGGFGAQGGSITKVYIPNSFQRHDQADRCIIRSTAGDAFRASLGSGIEAGMCTTGRSLDKTELEEAVMNGAIAKEMEAHAIAWVCDLFRQKYFMVKAVTDLVEHPTTGPDFAKNLGAARTKIDETLDAIIKLIDRPELGLHGRRRRLNHHHHSGVSPAVATLMHEINLQRIAHGELALET